MQVRTKGGKTTVEMTKPELEKLKSAAAIVHELARYPELHPTAGATAEALTSIANGFSAK